MSRDNIISTRYINEIQDNKNICEAMGCTANSTETVEVNAGKFGKIRLHLCSVCVTKFKSKVN